MVDGMNDETREALEKVIEVLNQLEENVNWLKFRIGTSEYWILSKERPSQDRVAGVFKVRMEGELDGWWLWTY